MAECIMLYTKICLVAERDNHRKEYAHQKA